jgi:hypothetical protein
MEGIKEACDIEMGACCLTLLAGRHLGKCVRELTDLPEDDCHLIRDSNDSTDRAETRTAIPAARARFASRRICFVVALTMAEVCCCCVIFQVGIRSWKIRQGGHQNRILVSFTLKCFSVLPFTARGLFIVNPVHCSSTILVHSGIEAISCPDPAATLAENLKQGPLYIDAKSWAQP